jgi:hypothetical protein
MKDRPSRPARATTPTQGIVVIATARHPTRSGVTTKLLHGAPRRPEDDDDDHEALG